MRDQSTLFRLLTSARLLVSGLAGCAYVTLWMAFLLVGFLGFVSGGTLVFFVLLLEPISRVIDQMPTIYLAYLRLGIPGDLVAAILLVSLASATIIVMVHVGRPAAAALQGVLSWAGTRLLVLGKAFAGFCRRMVYGATILFSARNVLTPKNLGSFEAIGFLGRSARRKAAYARRARPTRPKKSGGPA